MKKLYLHIGLGKTGSSALQSWLSLNSRALSKQGVDYADLAPEAKRGEVSSGNGYTLHQACINQDFGEVERLLTSSYFFNKKNDTALISCELFQGIRLVWIQKLHDICAKCNIDVTVIAYVRSVYEQSYSTYIQGIKRASVSHRFGEKSADIGFSKSVEFLRRYREVYGDRVQLINYDDAKKDIYASMAGILGVNIKGFKQLKKKVNRSLTLEEAEVLRRMNGLHQGVFATKLSDYMIKLDPNVDTPVFYDPKFVKSVREATEAELSWVNEQFNIAVPVVSDFYDGRSRTRSIPLTRASYQPVVKWAMDYDSGPELRWEFATFLKDLAVFIIDISVDDAITLMYKAQRVQFQAEQEAEKRALKEAEEDAAQEVLREEARKAAAVKNLTQAASPKPKAAAQPYPAPRAEAKPAEKPQASAKPKVQPKPKPRQGALEKRRFPKHMITYFQDPSLLNPEATARIEQKFQQWLLSLAREAIGGSINPVEDTHVLRSDSQTIKDKESTMIGYTLLDNEDMDAVLAIAAECPLLEVGAVLEVSRIAYLYGK